MCSLMFQAVREGGLLLLDFLDLLCNLLGSGRSGLNLLRNSWPSLEPGLGFLETTFPASFEFNWKGLCSDLIWMFWASMTLKKKYGIWGIAWWGINIWCAVIPVQCISNGWVDYVPFEDLSWYLFFSCGVDFTGMGRSLSSIKNCPASLLLLLGWKVGKLVGTTTCAK